MSFGNQIVPGYVGVDGSERGFAMASIPSEASERVKSAQLSQALGEAVVRLWGLLPPDVQHHLFEEAASHAAETRSQLAVFLHDKHPRTCASIKASAMIEPDSLGG
jgi:hypothetical protein